MIIFLINYNKKIVYLILINFTNKNKINIYFFTYSINIIFYNMGIFIAIIYLINHILKAWEVIITFHLFQLFFQLHHPKKHYVLRYKFFLFFYFDKLKNSFTSLNPSLKGISMSIIINLYDGHKRQLWESKIQPGENQLFFYGKTTTGGYLKHHCHVYL